MLMHSAILREMQKKNMILRTVKRGDTWKLFEEESRTENASVIAAVTGKQMVKRQQLIQDGMKRKYQSLNRVNRKIVDGMKPEIADRIAEKQWRNEYGEWRTLIDALVVDQNQHFRTGSEIEIGCRRNRRFMWIPGKILEILPSNQRQPITKYRVKFMETVGEGDRHFNPRCERIVSGKEIRENMRHNSTKRVTGKVTVTGNFQASWVNIISTE